MYERYRPPGYFIDDKEPQEAPPALVTPAAPKYDLPPAVVAERREWAKKFIKHNSAAFAEIAGDPSLTFELGDWFMIDLKHGKVYLSEETFIKGPEEGWSPEQIFWAACHEISHFRDLRENPQGMLENFERLWDRAAAIAPRVLDILRAKMGDPLPVYLTEPVPVGRDGRTVPWIETWVYKQIHRLYNGLDDMYVNTTLPLRTPIFHETRGQHGAAIVRLYRDILFPTNPSKKGQPPLPLQAADYEKSPKSSQLGDYLLRRRMVRDQPILISKEVRDALDSFPTRAFERRGIRLEDHVNHVTDPAEDAPRDPRWRYERIRDNVEPVWLKFFLKDLEEMPPPEKDDGKGKGKGNGKGQKQPGDPSGPPEPGDGTKSNPWDDGDKNPEPIDLDVIRDFIKQQEQKKKDDAEEKARQEKFNRMSWDDKIVETARVADRKLAEQYDVDPSWAEAYLKMEESVRPYKRELEAVFQGFMKTIEARMSKFLMEGFRSGKFELDSFIRKFGADIAEERYDRIPWNALTTFSREELQSRFEIRPNEIRVRLVIDGSGSMFDGERIEAAKQTAVLFLEALTMFEQNVNRRFRMRKPLKVNVEVSMFGDPGNSVVIKPFEGETSEDVASPTTEPERVRRFRMMGELGRSRGGTCDGEALHKVAQRLEKEPGRLAKLKAGKAIELLFEITDGGSMMASEEGADGVEEMANIEAKELDGQTFNVYPKAIQDARNALLALRTHGSRREAGVEFDGVIARAFQMGQILTPEKLREEYDAFVPEEGTEKPPFEEWKKAPTLAGRYLAAWEEYQFREVWGANGANVAHPSELAPAATAMLQREFEKLKVKMNFYEVGGDEEGEDVD